MYTGFSKMIALCPELPISDGQPSKIVGHRNGLNKEIICMTVTVKKKIAKKKISWMD